MIVRKGRLAKWNTRILVHDLSSTLRHWHTAVIPPVRVAPGATRLRGGHHHGAVLGAAGQQVVHIAGLAGGGMRDAITLVCLLELGQVEVGSNSRNMADEGQLCIAPKQHHDQE